MLLHRSRRHRHHHHACRHHSHHDKFLSPGPFPSIPKENGKVLGTSFHNNCLRRRHFPFPGQQTSSVHLSLFHSAVTFSSQQLSSLLVFLSLFMYSSLSCVLWGPGKGSARGSTTSWNIISTTGKKSFCHALDPSL